MSVAPFCNQHGGVYSAWARIRASADCYDQCEIDLMRELLTQHWEAVYAFFRAQQASSDTALRATAWLGTLAPMWVLRWPEALKFHANFRKTVRHWLETQSHNLISQAMSTGHAVTIPPTAVARFEESLAPLLAEGLPALAVFDRVWPWTIHWRAVSRVNAEWQERGWLEVLLTPAAIMDAITPQPALVNAVAHTGLHPEEVQMMWSRWKSRYIKLLREQVDESMVSREEADVEWAELFPTLCM